MFHWCILYSTSHPPFNPNSRCCWVFPMRLALEQSQHGIRSLQFCSSHTDPGTWIHRCQVTGSFLFWFWFVTFLYHSLPFHRLCFINFCVLIICVYSSFPYPVSLNPFRSACCTSGQCRYWPSDTSSVVINVYVMVIYFLSFIILC